MKTGKTFVAIKTLGTKYLTLKTAYQLKGKWHCATIPYCVDEDRLAVNSESKRTPKSVQDEMLREIRRLIKQEK